jgi:hypothetical protein
MNAFWKALGALESTFQIFGKITNNNCICILAGFTIKLIFTVLLQGLITM